MLMSPKASLAKRKRPSDEADSDLSDDILLPIKYVRISSECGSCSDQTEVMINRFPRVSRDGEPEWVSDYAQVNLVLRELAMLRELRGKYNSMQPHPTQTHRAGGVPLETLVDGGEMDCSGS